MTFKCQRVIGHCFSVGLSVSGCTGPTADRWVSLGSVHSCVHTQAAAGSIPGPCILHMSNLEAVIGQFCQDECLSKRP